MKRISLFIATALLALGLPAMAAQQITLLHVNDSHSHLAAWGPKDANLNGTIGGLPKAAAIIAAEKAADPNAIFVHAGDFMHGDLFFNEHLGVPELQILRSLGLDAIVLGNRDFQLGPDFLTAVIAAAWSDGEPVPILGSNIVAGSHPLGEWITPTLIKNVNGVKVGLFGLSYKGSLASPKPVVIVWPPDAAAIVQDLRDQGAQVIVCVTHFGMDRARALAQSVAGIDVIVNAHDNWETAQPETIARPGGGTTLIVSAGHLYRWVGRLRLSVDGDSVSFVDYRLLGADADTTPLPWVQATVDGLKTAIVARYGDVYQTELARAVQEIGPTWAPDHAKRDTPLGNLMTDAYRVFGKTDVGIEALGVLDDPIPAGPVVGADMFRAMSFGFDYIGAQQIVRPLKLVTFSTTGESLIVALNTMLWLGTDAFPQVSGMRFAYDSRRDSKKQILDESVEILRHEFEPNQLYSVATTWYVYDTLVNKLGVLKGKTQNDEFLPDLAFDAARAYAQSRGQLGPWVSNRIRDAAAEAGAELIPARDQLDGRSDSRRQ